MAPALRRRKVCKFVNVYGKWLCHRFVEPFIKCPRSDGGNFYLHLRYG